MYYIFGIIALDGTSDRCRCLPHHGTIASEDVDDEDDDNGPEAGPKALSSIELAHSPGMFFVYISFDIYIDY